MPTKRTHLQLTRRISLGFFLVVSTALTILHQQVANIPAIDAYCPFGGVETLYKYLAGGELLKRIEPSNILLLGAIILIGILLARFFCGWICAFGALQGVFGWIGTKLFKRRFTVPEKLDAILRYLKYAVLAGVLYLTWQTGTLFIRPYDPWAAYGHLTAGWEAIMTEFAVGFVLLVLSLALSSLYERAFCKYLCPLGAFNAILGRIPLFRIKRENSTCISCSKCDRACPMNVKVMTADTVTSPECIGCMECVTACPTKKETLKTFLAKTPVRASLLVIAGLGIYLGAIGIGAASKTFRFTAVPLAQKAIEGTLKIEDIKGSATWNEVAESFGVELSALYRAAGVDGSTIPPDTKLKDTAKAAGMEKFEADTARLALARMLGIAYSGESGTVSSGNDGATPAPGAAQGGKTAGKPLVIPADFALEGTMSVRDIAAALGADETAILERLALPDNLPRDKPLRDLRDQFGFSMPELKARFK